MCKKADRTLMAFNLKEKIAFSPNIAAPDSYTENLISNKLEDKNIVQFQ